MKTLENAWLLHTQEVTGSSTVAPTIPALANQQLAISIPKHFLLSFSKTYQNRIKTRSVPKQRIKTPKAFFLVGLAVQFGQRLPLHLQLHLGVLLEHLRISLPKKLRHPFVRNATRDSITALA